MSDNPEQSHTKTLMQILDSGEKIGLKQFRPVKSLGSGDTGRLELNFCFFELDGVQFRLIFCLFK